MARAPARPRQRRHDDQQVGEADGVRRRRQDLGAHRDERVEDGGRRLRPEVAVTGE